MKYLLIMSNMFSIHILFNLCNTPPPRHRYYHFPYCRVGKAEVREIKFLSYKLTSQSQYVVYIRFGDLNNIILEPVCLRFCGKRIVTINCKAYVIRAQEVGVETKAVDRVR